MTATRKLENIEPANLDEPRRLEHFAQRCDELAERVEHGSLTFLDAVDRAYNTAIWSGLVADLGDDRIQHVLALAFRGVRR